MEAITYTNRKEAVSYIRKKITKTGKTNFTATTKLKKGETPSDMETEMPEGYEFYENPVTGVVKVRKIIETSISEEELNLVNQYFQKGKHITITNVEDDAIVFYYPLIGRYVEDDLQKILHRGVIPEKNNDRYLHYRITNEEYESTARILKKDEKFYFELPDKFILNKWNLVSEHATLKEFLKKYSNILLKNSLSRLNTKKVDLPKGDTHYHLKVALAHSNIWRTFKVNGNTNLYNLHRILQKVMGWENAHLFSFDYMIKNRKGASIFPSSDDIFDMWDWDLNPEHDEALKLTIQELFHDPKSHILYTYDFGDSWQHIISVIETEEGYLKHTTCTDGAMACPPEDCGGVWGYNNLLEILSDKKHPEHNDYKDWAGDELDPNEFDIEEVNQMLKVRKL